MRRGSKGQVPALGQSMPRRAAWTPAWNRVLAPSWSISARTRRSTVRCETPVWRAIVASGAPDATIARQTGVSQRTVERRVRALMDQLGASTRFQAGVHAARRGLL